MTRAERNLQRLFYFSGVVLLLAAGAVFLPVSWMNWGHVQLGMGEYPHRPLTLYLTRSISALYAFHGVIILVIAGDVRRYLPLVRTMAIGDAVFGATLVGIDLTSDMPWFWTVAEGPSLIAFGIVIWVLQGWCHDPPTEKNRGDR